MNTLNTCPCCSNSLLHHFENHREYWFCRHCWSEMPNLAKSQTATHYKLSKVTNLAAKIYRLEKPVLVSI